MYVRAPSPPLLLPEPVLMSVFVVQKREQRCMYFKNFTRCVCMHSFACSLYFIRRHYPPAPHGPHIRLDQPRIIPLLGPHSLFPRPDAS